MIIDIVVVGQLEVNCYVVSGGTGPEAVIIDPGDDQERVAEAIDMKGLRPLYVVLTHAHYDHICAAGDLARKYRAPLVMHADEGKTYEDSKVRCISWGFSPDDFPPDYKTVNHGDRITAGSLDLEVIHTPGHTPGCICLYGNGTLFTGDTLFRGSVGRTDLPGGDTGQLMESLKKLTALPHETRVLCGHGEETTIGREMKSNPYLNTQSRLKLWQ